MKISDYLSTEEVQYYSRKSDIKGFRVLFANWLAIFAIFTIVYIFPNPVTIILSLILMGGRQLGLAVLMHDCGHRTLFKTQELNDSLGHWLCAMPVVSNLTLYATGRLQHHKHAGTLEEPDLNNYKAYPIDGKSFRRKGLRDIGSETGFKLIKAVLTGARSAFSSEAPKTENPFIQLLFVQAVLFCVLSLVFAPWVYLIWVGSFLTTFMLIVRLRQIAEHANVPDLFDLDPRKNTRTTIPRTWERMIFTPNWVNYHIEHHFMASVPCYRLKALHQLLKARGAYKDTQIFYGYVSVLRHAILPKDKADLAVKS
jgi:fatty acid desaturase